MLGRHVERQQRRFELDRFLLVFHGGEPLLFPKRRFVALQEKLHGIEERTGCEIERGVTTNAILIDEEWTGILNAHGAKIASNE